MKRKVKRPVLEDSRDGIPRFPNCRKTRRMVGLRTDRPLLTNGDLWDLGCYVEWACRNQDPRFDCKRTHTLIRKLAYLYRNSHLIPPLKPAAKKIRRRSK